MIRIISEDAARELDMVSLTNPFEEPKELTLAIGAVRQLTRSGISAALVRVAPGRLEVWRVREGMRFAMTKK